MKRTFFLLFFFFLCIPFLLEACCHTVFIPQSSGEDIVKDLFLAPFQAPPDKDCFSFGFTTFLGYDQSFWGNRIAQNLFGTNTLNFVGSHRLSEHRWKGTVLNGDNFGISPEAQQMLIIDPTIKRVTARFQLHIGFGEWIPNLWLKLILPFEHARWKLRIGKGNIEKALDDTPFNGGCMNLLTSQSVTPAKNLKEVLQGDFVFGNMTNPWKAGRFSFETHDSSELADLHIYLGYDFINRLNYHLSLYLLGVVPTGNHPHLNTVFYPIVGNGHYGELGAGAFAHTQLYNYHDEWGLTLYTAGHITHCFKTYQTRLFDLESGCLSRYLLMKEFIQSNNSTTVSSLIPGVNVLLRGAHVYIPLKGECGFELRFDHACNISSGVGYACYGKAAEKLSNICPLDTTVGIKGCAPYATACYFTEIVDNITVLSEEPPMSEVLFSTQSDSTISSCGTVDNPIVAATSNPDIICIDTCTNTFALEPGTPTASLPRAITSNPPRFVGNEQLNKTSATTGKQISHKIFFHIDYTFNETSWKPFISFGAQVQAAASDYTSALNMWGMWLQAGFYL